MISNKDFIHLLVLKSSLIMIFMLVLFFAPKVIFYFYLYNILFNIVITAPFKLLSHEKKLSTIYFILLCVSVIFIFKFFWYLKMVLS